MTQAPTNIGLSPDAETLFDNYLRQVRAALTDSPDVSPDEIEADIREHVENELRTAVRPVVPFVLQAVLNRLGPPTQWLPAGKTVSRSDLPSLWKYVTGQFRRIKNILWRGPEDWRLAYLTFGTFALGIFFLLVGTQEHSRGSAILPLGVVLLIASYFLSRAGINLIEQNGRETGDARRWLLYPPVVLASLVLFLVLIISPPITATAASYGAAHEADRQERWELAGEPRGAPFPSQRYFSNTDLKKYYPEVETTLDKLLAQLPRFKTESLALLFVSIGYASLWGMVIGLLTGWFPATIRMLCFPLGRGSGGNWARKVGLVCLLIFVMWCGLAYRIATDAGVL